MATILAIKRPHLFINGAVARITGNAFAGILYGLLALLSKGYKWVIIQTDNPNVVQALTDNGLENSSITILRRI
ncbi:hypothetical protein Goarm_010101 [Gossypium armourianum]|uniref:RNase H type-1 domain-containing protein n=1 Tax=Gossypium armourianum TaxID=34283 RepID=A0A7J9JV47_9ROSI|nr:hypothetical protein [Gossypium armourianum]